MPADRPPRGRLAALSLVLVLLLTTCPQRPLRGADDLLAADEKFLQEAKVATDGPGLLAFLRERSPTADDLARMEALIRQLGSESFEERQQASSALVKRGPPAVRLLQKALKDDDLEVSRRAARCLDEIARGPGPALPAAAVRLLAARKPAGAVEALLAFVPFADDDQVEEEVLAALVALGLRDGRVAGEVVVALGDRLEARRGAAAFVAGRSPDRGQRDATAALLKDAEPKVRFRAAHGLVAGRDPRGVPALIDLLTGPSADLTWRAEDLLLRIAGEQAPTTSPGTTAEERKQWQAAWAKWFADHEKDLDLARLDRTEPFLNLTLVCEMHGDKIWEVGRDGKVRWEMGKLQGPRTAQVLPGGRVLVAEYKAHKVTERDRAGNVVWSHPCNDPAYILRLPNGNTFLGNHERAFEVTPAGKEVFSYKPPEQGFLIHSMFRKRDGNLVLLSMAGLLREVNREGKEVRSFQLDANNRNWCGVEGLPGNRYLAVDLNQGEVLELDATGKVEWRCQVQAASYALRLPNGNTMVCSFGGQRVVEVNREGKVVWETKVGTSPWRAHVR
jgi:hypothetical protein